MGARAVPRASRSACAEKGGSGLLIFLSAAVIMTVLGPESAAAGRICPVGDPVIALGAASSFGLPAVVLNPGGGSNDLRPSAMTAGLIASLIPSPSPPVVSEPASLAPAVESGAPQSPAAQEPATALGSLESIGEQIQPQRRGDDVSLLNRLYDQAGRGAHSGIVDRISNPGGWSAEGGMGVFIVNSDPRLARRMGRPIGVKIFRKDASAQAIAREFAAFRLAQDLDLPVAKVFGSLQRSLQRRAIIKEFIEGKTGHQTIEESVARVIPDGWTARSVRNQLLIEISDGLQSLFSKSGIRDRDNFNSFNYIITPKGEKIVEDFIKNGRSSAYSVLHDLIAADAIKVIDLDQAQLSKKLQKKAAAL
jgi:hypothetical protein